MAAVINPELGRRINYAGNIGTIKYTGPVDGTKGLWFGVEWDDPSRGKHSGMKDGKQYFPCIVPNSGSFIRATANISYGVSFLAALSEKYNEIPRNSAGREIVTLGSSNGAIEVEAVGLDKIRAKLSRLDTLREVSLDNKDVASADNPGSIGKTCPGVRGLDLTKNLLPSWEVVAMIATELDQLERLALNQNRLIAAMNTAVMSNAFRKLREVQLNDTLISWYEFRTVAAFMPMLGYVEIGYNRLKTLEIPHTPSADLPQHPSIHTINFDSNELFSWTEICDSLRPLPALERLLLSSNKIERIEPISNSDTSSLRNLKHLALSCNALANWADLDGLVHWCPNLESLKLTGNPVVEDTQPGKNTRQLTIARIPSIRTLDAAAISSRERTDSELYYLSYITKHGPLDESARCIEHPRWKELCQKYGRPDEQATSSQKKRDTLGNRLLDIKIFRSVRSSSSAIHSSTNHSELPLTEPMTLRVLPTMTMRPFRLKVTKSYKLPRSAQNSFKLWLKMPHGALAELPADDDSHDLAWWGIESDSELILEEGE
ncbi:hypothetical protein QCA50_003637 [Cerrena zonata]|uniref:CAP-Gly domain-containing protein n=1 Tax=Cerrena zonata TaxID=2478898 RepID=A0AAW0GMT9_9APHY